jgi:hypothetical protein
MSFQSLKNSQDVYDEVLAIAKFQGIDGPEFQQIIQQLAKHFDFYAEFVISEFGLEVITATKGDVKSLAETALICGAAPQVIDAFTKCAYAFPGKVLGLKTYFGPYAELPSLYVRTMVPTEVGLNFLYTLPYVADFLPSLEEHIQQHPTTYYISFKGKNGNVYLKTYHIGDVQDGRKIVAKTTDGVAKANPQKEDLGFVSYRASRGKPVEVKYHLTNVGWNEVSFPNSRWQELAEFAQKNMNYQEMSYFGVLEQPNAPPDLKLYIERVGAIPTEYHVK